MVYETRNHRLIKDNDETIELTNMEHKLLMILSCGKLVTYEELAKYLYNLEIEYVNAQVHVLKGILQRKTKLDISTIHRKGYILTSEIYFK